jgi:hypothetical protein
MVSRVSFAGAMALSLATHSVPGLGEVTIVTAFDERVRVELQGPGFQASRSVGPRGELEIVVSGGGELIALSVRVDGRDRLSLRRGATVVSGVSNLSALRTLTDGRAVASFRETVGEYERRLLSEPAMAGSDDPHGHGFLLAGAFVGALAGDPTAVARARDVLIRGAAARRHAAGRDVLCAARYDQRLIATDQARSACYGIANADDSWHARTGQRLLCDATYVAAVASAEVEFLGCRSPHVANPAAGKI